MMKVIKYTLWALGIAALSACTIDEMDSAFDKVPVEFSVVDSAAAQMTRATSSITTFNASETVKVYVKPNGASSYTGYDYTTAAAGNAPSLTAPSTPPYFPAGSSTTVQAYAYYPSTAGSTFSVNTNQTSNANYKASDLMYASNRTITKGSTTGTALAMSHKMAQLKLVVAAASGSGLSISSVKVNAKYQVSFTASSGAATVTGSATDITALTAAGTGYILIPPQAINGITVKVTASSQTATYTFTSTNSLEAGKSYTMNLTVGLNDVGVTTSISTWTGSGSVTVNPTVTTEVTNAPANAVAVDLGLSVKWANMNVGATAVTDYGTYFAWGETSGYTVVGASDTPASGNVKTFFSWDTYAWGRYSLDTYDITFTKYCPTDKQSSSWWDPSGDNVAADNKTQLELGDDAARANWGGNWRMPTQTEMQELADTKSNTTNYAWTWCDGSSVKYNNTTVKGWKIESKKSGTAGNHIFLPVAGCYSGTGVIFQGSGYYWSSSLGSGYPNYAYALNFGSGSANVNGYYRYLGYTVRPVQSN